MRYNVAAQMVPLCEALGPEMTRAELVPAYIRLLEDTEAEVRIAAAGKVSAFSKMLTPPLIVSQVVPRVKELANDTSQFVRAALAGVVMELAPQLGKQPTIEHLVPVFLNLLRDPYPDVRLNVISKLDQVGGGRHLGQGQVETTMQLSSSGALFLVLQDSTGACRSHRQTALKFV